MSLLKKLQRVGSAALDAHVSIAAVQENAHHLATVANSVAAVRDDLRDAHSRSMDMVDQINQAMGKTSLNLQMIEEAKAKAELQAGQVQDITANIGRLTGRV